ncbi:MAG: DUF3592 domain-containing protein [Nesterenkonia sp.]|uniref:DUF3592 domain-containing protein n=1 Tax=Nesterenkonia marinintestina TaxID=2979865 RepID=UPI0021C184FC|nr:DUF3592 domain-containing protein [Nesterenkonia sp. GX14115]MDO5492823.1 DUF3592 domain-containing protein [Nesterenkonia sp.]
MSVVPPLLGLLVTLTVFGSMVVVGLRRRRARDRLIRGGVPVRAVVVGVRRRAVDTSWAHHPVVRYELYGRTWESEPRDGEHMPHPRGRRSARSEDRSVGQTVDVVVDPRDPVRSAVPIPDRLAVTLIAVGGTLGGLTLILGLLALIVTALGRG